MFSWDKGTKIAIWGTGTYARRFYLRYRDYFRIAYFIDNFPKQDTLDNLHVLHVSEFCGKKRNVKVIVAVEKYEEICEQCHSLGMRLLEDYLPYDLVQFQSFDFIRWCSLIHEDEDAEDIFERLLQGHDYSLVVGNCQTPTIRKILLSSRQFCSQYLMAVVPEIFALTEKDKDILKNNIYFLEKCSLLITQPISENNSFFPLYATNVLKSYVQTKGRVLVIPVLYFDLYFPQTVHQERHNILLEGHLHAFPYADCILNELAQRYSVQEVAEIVHMDNLFSKQFLEWFTQTRIVEYLHREQTCDVKIYDFILQNFRREQLFHSKNHPNRTVLTEFGRRILETLGIEDCRAEQLHIEEIDTWQEIIYPSVASFYALRFHKNLYKERLWEEECELTEWIRGYISCVLDKAAFVPGE